MSLSVLLWTALTFLPQGVLYDLEATEVVVKTTDAGERYFSYLITNVGSEIAPAGSYEVFLSVNGRVISLDTKTSALDPGKSLLYTSETKFTPSDKKNKPLKFKLKINTKDANKANNQYLGTVSW
ncbi:MAG: hypothetical protein JJU34_00425 [Lunatimonas sp.]|uniref:hypothetical protein n=1 Tax=Lunatimonas sp. TaxID=2060141 RepID=UPI00263B9B68|nr:hypothetical protein [Lunatimonas sp.]MCC5935720.1 hypothetical protein [Lunatimonas sp.]